MPPPKTRTKTEREEVLAKVAQLDRRGYTQKVIAEKVGVSIPQICYYLKKLRMRYIEAQLEDRSALVAMKIEQYREIRKEAWEAWERSKEDKLREVKDFGTPVLRFKLKDEDQEEKSDSARINQLSVEECLVLIKKTVTKEGRLPSSEYLNIIMETLTAERKLLGLDESLKIDLTAQVINWNDLYTSSQQPRIILDPVEEKIRQEILADKQETETIIRQEEQNDEQ